MDSGQNQKHGATKEQPQTAAGHKHDPVYYYKDSGIQEHHGYVPLWLRLVAISLVVWGIYYLVAFWSPPP